MRYRLKQQLFTLAHSFTVEDRHGNPAFEVSGKLLSLGDQFTFRDTAGKEVGQIHQTKILVTPTFEIYTGGRLAGVFESTLINRLKPHNKFTIDLPDGDDLVATGDIWGFEYELRRGKRLVATVSKDPMRFADTYDVNIVTPDLDHVLALAITIAIDAVCFPGRT